MKKIILFLFFILPMTVSANTASIYKEAHVKSNGDVLVKDYVQLNGNYNGLELFYTFQYFEEDAIFGADEFELIKVCEANMKQKPENCFKQVSLGEVGDRRIYEYEEKEKLNRIKMFNPSDFSKKAFYLEYVLKNVVVKHEDIAELRLNLLDISFKENLDIFEMYIYLPKEYEDFRIWGHGPLYGETKKIDAKTGKLVVEKLPANTMVDLRMTFSNDLVFESTKTTNEKRFNLIIEEENLLALEANKTREKYNFLIYKLPYIWLAALFIIWLYIYFKHDKEHKNEFNEQYYRELPTNFPLETVQFLMEKRIDTNSLSASLLNIIRKKGLLIEEIETKAKLFSKNTKDYKLILNDDLKEELTESEKYIREWFLESFGDSKSFELSNIKKTIKDEKSSNDFMKKYKKWEKDSKTLANKENFYEKKSMKLWIPIIYGISPIIGVALELENYLFFFIIGFLFVIYLLVFVKRTKEGNEYFHKYKALKRFLNDFGNFEDKELPEVYLWEKYLVFATLFKISEKLMKTMEIKLQKIKEVNPGFDSNVFTYLYLNNTINRSVRSSVNNAYTTATREIQKAAASRSSSGGGFGGGFSGGGGFGGGGGMGGGRF